MGLPYMPTLGWFWGVNGAAYVAFLECLGIYNSLRDVTPFGMWLNRRGGRITYQQRLSDLIGHYRGTYGTAYRVFQPLLVCRDMLRIWAHLGTS